MINHTTISDIWNPSGTFDNYGRIDIASEGMSGGSAIENDGAFTNHNCSFIFIHGDQFINDGNDNTTPIINNGVIHTQSTRTNIVDNTNGTIYNTTGGSFPSAGGTIVTTPPTAHIWQPCDPTDSRDWFSYANWHTGLVPTSETDAWIFFPGVVGKQGVPFPIIDQENAEARSVLVDNGTTLTIEEGASLSINELGQSGVINGLVIRGTVDNEGTVDIADMDQSGIYLSAFGRLTNREDATIRIDDVDGHAIFSDAGLVKADETVKQEQEGGFTISNTGNIFIGESQAIGEHGIHHTTGHFGNIDPGVIRIRNVGGDGINNSLDGEFTNAATLEIQQTGEHGINNNNIFTNARMSTWSPNSPIVGQININQTGKTGIFNENTFTNQGNIQTSHTTDEGIVVEDGAVFRNQFNAEIRVNGGEIAVKNGAELYNFDCGYINLISNHTIQNSGYFGNNGILIENSNGGSKITVNNGVVYNLNGGSIAIDLGTGIVTTNPQHFYWTGCGPFNVDFGGFTWEEAKNWSTHTVPTPVNPVTITTAPMVINTFFVKSKQEGSWPLKQGPPIAVGPFITTVGAVAQSLTTNSFDPSSPFDPTITVAFCASLSINTHIQNDGEMHISRGLLRIGTNYGGTGIADIGKGGFVYQPTTTPANTFPACNSSNPYCLSVNPTDAEFITDNDGDDIPLCQGDLDELNNLSPPVTVQLTVLLEGGYAYLTKHKTIVKQGDAMSANLTLPNIQPFNQAPWNYDGSENVTDIGGMPAGITAWLLIEIYSDLNHPVPIARQAALLRNGGRLVNPATGADTGIPFPSLQNGNSYYVTVRHRNHLAVMSSQAIPVNSSQLYYDFSAGENQALGGGQLIEIFSSIWALPAGDMNSDGIISVEDYNFFISQAGQSNGVFDADLDLDGVVEVDDFNLYQQNSSKIGISAIRY